MLFFIFVVLFIVGFAIVFSIKSYESDTLKLLGEITTAVSGMVIAFSLIIMCEAYITAGSNVAENKQRYEILTYQIQTQMYNNDNEYGKQELMQKIQDWNEDLARYQSLQKNLMVGIYIPNVFDQFEFIDYSSVK